MNTVSRFSLLTKAKEVSDEIKRIYGGNVERFIGMSGFEVVEFNTPEGDEELKRINLYEEVVKYNSATKHNSITIKENGTLYGVIAINGKLSFGDKKHLILHELGHIVLIYLDNNKTSINTGNLSISDDNAAEVFAYMIRTLENISDSKDEIFFDYYSKLNYENKLAIKEKVSELFERQHNYANRESEV